MAVLRGMPTTQYLTRNTVFFKLNDLHISTALSSVMTNISRDSIVDRSSLPVSALCAIGLYCQLASNIAENLGKVSSTECSGKGNDFELILTVKTETKHPVDGSFGNEFPSLYNHCRVMAAWSRETLKKFRFFGVFFWKNDPLWENFRNSAPKGFIMTPTDMLCSNFVKLGWRKLVKSCMRCALESEFSIRLNPSFEPNKNTRKTKPADTKN